MTDSDIFDAAVVGGGVLGCTTALHLARGGMRVVVLEARALASGASGVNAGTLSIQIKRAVLVPYAIKSVALWRTARDWLGMDAGYVCSGGLTVAFNDAEAARLEDIMAERRAAGAPIEMVGPQRARQLEPGLSHVPVLASWCPLDGYANSSLTGRAYRRGLEAAGVRIMEQATVRAIDRASGAYTLDVDGHGTVRARRLVLATSVWAREMTGWLGLSFPIVCHVNTLTVTERHPVAVRRVIMAANGRLTLKQVANGTIVIGGAWRGTGSPARGPERPVLRNLIGNLRLAHAAVPALAGFRAVRTWLGLEDNTPDYRPLVGPLPGLEEAYIIACIPGGYTIGPYMGMLLAQRILEREPEMPIFDPAEALGAYPDHPAIDHGFTG